MPIVDLNADFIKTATCPPHRKRVDFYSREITGFIYELRASGGAGTYYLRYRNAHGRQCQHKIGDGKSLSFEKARQAAITLRSRVVLGQSPMEERKKKRAVPTLAEFTHDRYLPYIKGSKKSWATDDSHLRKHILPAFGGSYLDSITQKEVIEFHHGMRAAGYAPATCNRKLILLRYMFNLAAKWGIEGAEKNPTAGVPLYELNNARERFLTPEETRHLQAALEESENPQMRFIVPLLLLTGMRKSELLKSRWEHIDFARRDWLIPMSKSGKARHVAISSAVAAILERLPRWEGVPYVVPNPTTGRPFSTLYCCWNTIRKKAGMPELRLHDLRHSFASNLINSGHSLYVVSKALGRSQLRTTERYSHLDSGTLLAAADAAAEATGIDWV